MLDDQKNVLKGTSYVIEAIDPDNLKALMRRAYAYRDSMDFTLALQDLKKLKELMHPNDKALKEVRKLHNSCIRGIE